MERPVPPRSPRTHCGMMHVIHHRFGKTVKVKSVLCGLCEKPMFIGFKCKECKYRCHRDCVDKVPPSCGLPSGYMEVFKRTIDNNEGRRSPLASYSGQPTVITSPSSVKSESLERERPKRLRGHFSNQSLNVLVPFPPDSSSNTSSCTSSTPSSPALLVSSAHTPYSASKVQSFQFPEVSNLATTSFSASDYVDHTFSPPPHPFVSSSPAGTTQQPKSIVKEFVETQKSNDSDKTMSGASGSTSTDSEKTLAGRIDSIDSQVSEVDGGREWPRQNSLNAREWDIPFDDVQMGDKLGTGLFGTVYKGQWHGDVAVKLLTWDMTNTPADKKVIESFKQEVAMFRKTRHENLVLFMGACMKPPHLAIITSLCKGQTLYTHIHIRKDKFALSRTLAIAQQISQGMSYLHARGIIHKDLKASC